MLSERDGDRIITGENQKREENIEQVFFIFPGKWRRREKRKTQEERREQVLWVSTIMTVTATSSAGDDGVIEEAKRSKRKCQLQSEASSFSFT